VSNQDIEGNAPASETPRAPEGTPASLEQQLAKEREAKTLMRDRLRHTEALAAESHALRARMAQELERVTADRDRLRNAAVPPPGTASTTPPRVAVPPMMTPHATDWPLRPPEPPRRSGPWRALAMLGGLASAIGALAWFTGSLPGETTLAARSTPATEGPVATSTPAVHALSPAASGAVAAAPMSVPSGAVPLLPLALTPEAQLAAAPSAAGPQPAGASAGIAGRLRKALDGEGIAAPVQVDAASGHVMVADPQSDDTLRDRTDMLIRAVYAGASLPEPQIEHRWVSPRRGDRPAPVAQAAPARAPVRAASVSPAAAYAARHSTAERAADRHRQGAAATVADIEELRVVLPEGRVTANCRAGLAGRSTPHRSDMTACMKSSCCSSANRQAEDCKAYDRAYPFTCSAG
jgi:hypothetical protein